MKLLPKLLIAALICVEAHFVQAEMACSCSTNIDPFPNFLQSYSPHLYVAYVKIVSISTVKANLQVLDSLNPNGVAPKRTSIKVYNNRHSCYLSFADYQPNDTLLLIIEKFPTDSIYRYLVYNR